MSYNYRESTHLSREDSLAIKSLAATGELPNDHYWNVQRAKHDANPTRYDRGNYVLAALLDRDQLQRQGVLSANSPLFPHGGFFSYAGAKHDLNATRFDHWHPFLGRLFEIKLPSSPAAQGVTPPSTGQATTTPVGGTTPIGTTTPILPGNDTGTGGSGGSNTSPNPPSNFLPPSSGTDFSPGGGGDVVTSSPPPVVTPSAVPEPSSAVMLGLALALGLTATMLTRLARRGRPHPAQLTPA